MNYPNIVGVSVIICCYNSANRLITTIEHIANQKVNKDINWELIIVNNKSTDDTEAVAHQLTRSLCASIKTVIVNQTTPGLSFAREKGIETAKYEYLLFCDDDNWLSENYVQKVFEIMHANSNVGALGGWGLPEFEVEPIKWVKENEGIFATGPQANQSGELTKSHHVYGAGCTYRKSAIKYLKDNGFEYQLSGRKGNKMMAGEDHELCHALYLSGYKIWYNENLVFKHYIPKERASIDTVKDMIRGFAHCNVTLKAYKVIIAKGKPKNIKKSWLWLYFNLWFFIIKNTKLNQFLNLKSYSNFYTLLYFILLNKKFTTTKNILNNAVWMRRSFQK